jgi:tripartite-type tricarboxylate transporter receptor subunit TctC
MRFQLRLRALMAVALVAVATQCVSAQALAAGPIRILVGFGAGGGTDVAARLIAAELRSSLGQTVVVENRPGAGGRIAAEGMKSAPSDGSVLMLAPMVVPVLAPLVFRQLGYDPGKDLAPVAQVATFQFGFAVAPNHPATTASEFFAWAGAAPGRGYFGTVAPGGIPHFFGIMLGRATGVDMTHVAYSGIGTLATDVIGGQIPACVDGVSNLVELHRAGKIRIIATSGARRSPLLPSVPSFQEQGLPTIEGTSWLAMFAPARTPRAVIDRLSTAIGEAVRAPEVANRFVALGFEPTGSTPEQLAVIMAADTARWAPIVKASGFTAE